VVSSINSRSFPSRIVMFVRAAAPGAEAICAACPDARACANVPCVTCGGQVEVHIVIPCPRGRW
jgi:hypothetical protein